MQTKQHLYVIGHPVAHSKSPVMHNAVYQELGLNWEYDKADFPQEQQAREFLDCRAFLGINITTPYKPLALALAAWVHPLAQLAGGANVLINKQGVLHAYNTDGMGCVQFLQSQGAPFKDAPVVVCGTGPTAFSIAGAAAEAGAQVLVVSRNAEKSQQAVAQWMSAYESLGVSGVSSASHASHAPSVTSVPSAVPCMQGGSYAECMDDLANAAVIIDATPLGMREGDPAPFDTSVLREDQWVFDTVYGHGETALAAAARSAKCQFRSGEGMLVGQAVLAVQLFLQAAGIEDTLGFSAMAHIMHKAAFSSE